MGVVVTDSMKDAPQKNTKSLPFTVYLAYGMGHVLNDVCAAMWFSYLLVFFHLVLQFEHREAGILLLVGQVADAMATPFVGYHSDKNHTWWIYRFGKRKIWYFLGTICVIFTFPFIFSPCIQCENSSRVTQMMYYSVFIVIFQFGWASVQISHMSLIPEITSNEHQRTQLAAIRNGATVVASVLVYLVTWGILNLSGSDAKIGIHDIDKFQHIVWSVMSFGIVCSVIFYIFVKEPTVISDAPPTDCGSEKIPINKYKELFSNYNLYLVAIIYMASRLFINLTQVFLSLYLSETLDMLASALALVPLAMYISSFVASFPIGPLTKKIGRKFTFFIGAVLGLAGCAGIQFGNGASYTTYYIFVVAAVLGAASTVLLVSSLDITADLIGIKTNNGALIYGLMSFADKLSNGIAVERIQTMHDDEGSKGFYRNVLTYVCGGAIVLGMLAIPAVRCNSEKQNKPNSEPCDTIINTIA